MAELNRKTLKKPDEFLRFLREFFQGIAKNSRQLGILLVAITVLLGGTAFVLHQKEEAQEEAAAALFRAREALAAETQAITAQLQETQKQKNPKQPQAKPKAPEAQSARPSDDGVDLVYRPLDVQAVYPKTIDHLQELVAEYEGSRAAYEASLLLGNLFYEHGQADRSQEWYQRAVDGAPGELEKTLSLTSLGYAYENSQKFELAASTFETALKQDESAKGDLLLSLARVREAQGKTDEARGLYDRVKTELPNSRFSRKAELYRGLLD